MLTGGNGRQANLGETQYYQVKVGAGMPELNSTVTLGNNPNNQFYAFLVDPAGEAEAFSANDSSATTPAAGYRPPTPSVPSSISSPPWRGCGR